MVKRQVVLVQLVVPVLIQASTASNEHTGQRDPDDETMVRTLVQSTFTVLDRKSRISKVAAVTVATAEGW
jgi:hypothetical protein